MIEEDASTDGRTADAANVAGTGVDGEFGLPPAPYVYIAKYTS
jgi:hypothetical protein